MSWTIFELLLVITLLYFKSPSSSNCPLQRRQGFGDGAVKKSSNSSSSKIVNSQTNEDQLDHILEALNAEKDCITKYGLPCFMERRYNPLYFLW